MNQRPKIGPSLLGVGPEVARDAQVDLVGLVAELGLDHVLEVEAAVAVDGDLEGREGLVALPSLPAKADAHDHDVAVVVVEGSMGTCCSSTGAARRRQTGIARFYAERAGWRFGRVRPSLAAAGRRARGARLRGGVTARATAARAKRPLLSRGRVDGGAVWRQHRPRPSQRDVMAVPARGTDDRSPRYSCAGAPTALFVFAATRRSRAPAFSTTIGSFVNARRYELSLS